MECGQLVCSVLCPSVSDHIVTMQSGPEGSQTKHQLVRCFVFLSVCVKEWRKKLVDVHNSHEWNECEYFALSTCFVFSTLQLICTRIQNISLVVFLQVFQSFCWQIWEHHEGVRGFVCKKDIVKSWGEDGIDWKWER